MPVVSINPNTTSIKIPLKTLIGAIAAIVMGVVALVGAYYGLASKVELKEMGAACSRDIKEQRTRQQELERLQNIQENAISENKRQVAEVKTTLKSVTEDTDYIKVRIDFLTENAVSQRAVLKAEGSPEERQAAKKAAYIFKKRQEKAPDDPAKQLEGL